MASFFFFFLLIIATIWVLTEMICVVFLLEACITVLAILVPLCRYHWPFSQHVLLMVHNSSFFFYCHVNILLFHHTETLEEERRNEENVDAMFHDQVR